MSASWHQDYERGRPGYPRDVVRVPGLAASATVLEVGAGTGKLTRLLVTECGHVLSIEPDPEMRRWLSALCSRSLLLAGTAEQVPLADASVDGLFAGRMLPLVCPRARSGGVRAGAAAARRARPDVEQAIRTDLRTDRATDPSGRAAARTVLAQGDRPAARPRPESVATRTRLATRVRALDVRTAPGAAVRQPSNHRPRRPAGVFGSMGWIGTLPDEQRLTLLTQVRSRLTASRYRLPFETRVHWTRLTRR